MRFFKKLILLLLLLSAANNQLFGQSLEEKEKKANQLFEDEKYVEATRLFSEVLAIKKRDPDINFKYGTCLLFNSNSKEDAIPYLRFATKSATVDPRAHFFMGRAYHLNYQFNEAIKYYEKFEKIGSASQVKDFQVELQIRACQNGKKLLADINDIIVLQKTEIKKESFYEIFDLSDIGGTILRTDEFQSKEDKKRGHRPIIHFPQGSNKVFYSSYGDDGSTGLDIYMIQRLPDGSWSKAQKVMGSVNTFADEDYPYFHPNGYLYFSSKGHNSMGGYDVFKSKYNSSDNSFGPPENQDFAISSPDDDVFYVADSLNKKAYFASARESQDGKLFVYSVRVQRIPMQLAIIKGDFINTIDPDNRSIQIVVEDFSSGREIGKFNSKKSGGYLITFPKSGKYSLMVTVDGSQTDHGVIIDVPYIPEIRPLKQEMTLELLENGEEQLRVKNLFDEEFENPETIMAEVYKELGELLPNAGKFDLDSLDEESKNNEILAEAGLDPFATQDEIIKTVEKEIEDLQAIIVEEETQANIAYNMAEVKSDEANQKMVEINQLVSELESTTDADRKKEILEEILEKRNDADRLNKEATKLTELGKEIETSVQRNKAIVESAGNIAEELKGVNGDDRDALTQVVKNNQLFFEENVKSHEPNVSVVEKIQGEGKQSNEKLQAISDEISEMASKRTDLIAENKRLEKRIKETKKKKDQEALQREIDLNKDEIVSLDRLIESKNKEYDEAVVENESGSLSTAADLVIDPSNNTAENKKKLTKEERLAIDQKVRSNDISESIASIDKVLKDNNINDIKVDLFANDETTKNYSLAEWTEEIDKQVVDLRKQLSTASPEEKKKIEEEIIALEELKEQKIKEFEVVETNPNDIKEEVNKEEILEDYTSRKEEIGEIVNENDRKAENLKLNEELKENIVEEKGNLEKILEDDPGNKAAKERLKNLEEMEAVVDEEIKNDREWIENNSNNSFNPDNILSSLDEDYENKVNTIYQTIPDDEGRKAEIQKLNESLLQKADERTQELEAILASDPSNQSAKDELTYLNELKDNLNSNQGEPLTDPVLVDLDNLDSKVVKDELLDGYNDRNEAIAAIDDEVSRKQAENVLNKELKSAVEKELQRYESVLAENPGNKNLEKKIENLQKLKEELGEEIDDNNSWIAENQPNLSSDPTYVDVKATIPGYQAEVNKIDKIEDDGDRTKAVEELNRNSLDDINDRLEELDEILTDNPEDRNASSEKEKLENLKQQIEDEPGETLIQPTNLDELNTKPDIGEIMPSYSTDKDRINATADSEIERESEKIKLNERLVELIDAEIEALKVLKDENPDDAKNIDKRIEELEKIKAEKQLEIEASREIVGDEVVAVDREKISIATIMPDYDSRWTNINNSTDPEVSKLENINALNNELISKLDLKIQKLEDEKSTNPGQLDAIEKDIENIEKIKQQKQNEIDRNLSRIEDLEDGNSTTASRAEITVESLMPDYVSRLGEIESSDASESDKLKQQNGVHNDLISAIDNKILELNTEKSQNSDQADLIDKDIEDIERMKTAKLNEINQNNNRIAELGTTASDNTNNTNRAEITVESLMPDYMSRLGEIENGDASESDKLKQQNGVHNDLISAIDKKVAELNAEKSQNPDQADLIDKDIENIERMKTAKLNEINQNNNRIAELGTTASDNTNNTDSQADRQAVTIESIMPDYEERKLAIENSGADELTQLEEKMALNKELMAAIDAKNDDFETEKSNNPEQANAIDKDIESLADIRKRTENENQSFSSQIESLTDVALTNGSDTKSLNEIETSDFKAPENQESLEELNDNLADIETLEAEIEVLERSKEEAGSDKEKAKIEKEISARKLKLAVVENNTLEQLAEMNENEFESSKEEFNKNSAGVRSSDPSSTDLASANEDLKTAEQKMNQAADIRDEASNTKDPIEKNEKLKEAFELEEEAKSLVKGANRKLKAAIVTYEYANKNGEEVILEVPENPEDRQSTQYANTADELDQKAADLEERAATLRDSSETVKKKYRQAILEEATALDEEAAELKTEADQMRAKGAELKEKEDAVAAVLPERTNKQVDEETKNEVASSDDYKEYKDLTDSGDKKMEEARELDEEIKNLKDKQARKIKMAIVTYESSEEAKSAVENDPEVKALQDEINQLQKKQEDLKNGAIEDYTKAQESIADKGPEDQENIRALASQGVEPTENTNNDVAVTEPGQADFKAPEAVNNDIFRTTNDAVYSERAPIPVDEKSSGLVYKVQVGAFRNPLPQDHFDRFAPISGEKLNNGITRYMAGYFTKFNSANDARNQIRGLGYGDAFVVAYCNGERISVSRARQIENGEIECIGTAGQQDFVDNGNNTNNTNTTDNNNNTNDGGNNNTSNDNSANNNNDNDTNNTNNNTADNNNSTDTNANDSNGGNDNNNAGNNDTANNNANNNSTNNATSNNNDSNYYNSVDGAAPADQVEDIKGLFFTVQIGVYSKPVPPSTLYNIKPLNSQLISGGRIRYTTGKYTSVESATGRKNEIVGIGISDAFVTAYYDGQRISIQQARDILARDGNKALYDSPENQSGAVTTNDVENKGPFIVEVGYFEEGDVPQDFTDLLEENQDEKFLSQTDFDDNVLYYAGPFDTKEEADAKRAELQGKGFTVAEVKPVQGQDDPDFATDNNNSNSSYVKEGVYYRILVGKFADAVPGEYATLLIQTENLFDTEQDIEGNTYMYSTKIEDFDEVRERIAEFADLGIEDMQIVSYYKYEPIPKEQADAILNDEEVGELTPYEAPQGISADEYLYQTEAIYYRVRLGRFDQEVPSDFANNILMHSEDESIEQEETFEGEIIFYSLSKKTYTEIEADKARLVEKGFVDSKIVAFHKYDQISVEKARKLLGQ